MRIGLDVQSTLGKKTGLGHYTENLVKNLQKIDKRNEYVFFQSGNSNELRSDQRVWWEQFRLPREARQARIDLLHSPAFSAPIIHPCKTVITLHDIIVNLFPKNVSVRSRWYWRDLIPFSARRADFVITDSENTKKDLVEKIGLSPQQIEVIYLAASSEFHPCSDEKRKRGVKSKYGIGSDYLLYVGTIEPRKNLDVLVKAFDRFKKTERTDHKLVIAGGKGWYFDELQAKVAECGLVDDVICTDYVDPLDLPVLYEAAELFIYPSVYEGFGLPVLEAMASGAPVICSSASSLPEIAGEAALLFDPAEFEELASLIKKVLFDQTVLKEMKRKSLDQAAKFSWEKTARQTLAAYERLMP